MNVNVNLQFRYRSLSTYLPLFPGVSLLVLLLLKCYSRISRDGQEGFEWMGEDESTKIFRRMGKKKTGRWLARND